jgi:hypothetical protein
MSLVARPRRGEVGERPGAGEIVGESKCYYHLTN